MKTTHSFNIDEKLANKLREKANETGLTMSALVTMAVRKARESKMKPQDIDNKKMISVCLFDKDSEYLKNSKSASKFLNEILKEEL
ncbi:MAG: hypothetical protein RSB50_06150 [Cetobacterium sp.]